MVKSMMEGGSTTLTIIGETLPDCWEEAIYRIYTQGLKVWTEYDMYARCAMPMTMEIGSLKPKWHKRDPFCSDNRIKPYREQLSREYMKKLSAMEEIQRFDYLYIDYLTHYPSIGNEIVITDGLPTSDRPQVEEHTGAFEASFVDQLAFMHDQIVKERFESKRLQAVTWIPKKHASEANTNQPCLQRIWVFIHRNYSVDVHIHYRSWDMWKAFEANLVAFEGLIQNELLQDTAFTLGRVKCIGDNCHIYEDDWTAVEDFLVKTGRLEPAKA